MRAVRRRGCARASADPEAVSSIAETVRLGEANADGRGRDRYPGAPAPGSRLLGRLRRARLAGLRLLRLPDAHPRTRRGSHAADHRARAEGVAAVRPAEGER